jgi:hypothetical protein
MIFAKHPELSASAIRSLSGLASAASGSTSCLTLAAHHRHLVVAAVSTRRGCARSRIRRSECSRVCRRGSRRGNAKRAVDISVGHTHSLKRCAGCSSHLYTLDAQKNLFVVFDFFVEHASTPRIPAYWRRRKSSSTITSEARSFAAYSSRSSGVISRSRAL